MSLPYEARSWATSTTSATPRSARDAISSRTLTGERDRCFPRNWGSRRGTPRLVEDVHGAGRHTDWLPSGHPVETGDQLRIALHPDDRVGLGKSIRKVALVALRHAAEHDQAGVLPLTRGVLEDHVDRLLTRRFDEGAGVHHHHVGGLRRVGLAVPRACQQGLDLVRVDLVLGAAEGGQPNGG